MRAVDVDLSLEEALDGDGAGVSAQPRGRERRRGPDGVPPAVVVVVDDLLRGVDRGSRGGLEANAAGLLLGDAAVRDGVELAIELVVQLLGVLVLDVAASGGSGARLLVALAPDFLRWGSDCRIGETGRRSCGARRPTGGPLQPGGALGGDPATTLSRSIFFDVLTASDDAFCGVRLPEFRDAFLFAMFSELILECQEPVHDERSCAVNCK